MRNLKKIFAFFMVMTMAFGRYAFDVYGASAAQTSYDMEEWVTDAAGNPVPKGFTVEAGEGAVISCEETEIAGNTTKKLKIYHPETTTTKVSVHVLDSDVAWTPISVYWSFFLGADFEGTGLKLSSVRADLRKTDYFKDNSYTWWRKMMVYHGGYGYQSDYVAEFTGKGTVYLDDVSWELSRIINGDFEGLCADGHLAGVQPIAVGSENITGGTDKTVYWSYTNGSIQSIKRENNEAATTLSNGVYFVETPQGNYIELRNIGRAHGLKYVGVAPNAQATDLITGKNYVLHASHMSSNGQNGLTFATETGFTVPTDSYGIWTTATKTMSEKAFYTLFNSFINPNFSNPSRPVFYLKSHNNGSETEKYARIDKVYLEEVQESCTLTDMDGKPTAFENGKKVNVSYQKPLFDGTKDTLYENFADYTMQKVNGKTSKEKVAVFAALYDVTTEVPKLMEIDVCGNLVAEALFPSAVPTSSYDSVGYLPAMYSLEEGFDIPEEGEYMLKVFTLDSVSGLTPKGENVYTFMMEAE